VSSNTGTVTGAGTVVVRASQAGNDSYNAADSVDQFFKVNARDAERFPAILPNGDFQVILTGEPNREYEILGSDDLLTWDGVSVITADAVGVLDFLDQKATQFPLRFYRARLHQ
jgi:hypothetical protein